MKRILSTSAAIAGAALLGLLAVTPILFYLTQHGFTQIPYRAEVSQPAVTVTEHLSPQAPMGMPGIPVEPTPGMAPPGMGMSGMGMGGMGMPATLMGPLPPGQPLPPGHPVIMPPTPLQTIAPPVLKAPRVIRAYSFKEMLAGLDTEQNLIIQIVTDQLLNEFPDSNTQFYDVPGKPAIIIAAPQYVHDGVGRLLESLREVCDILRKLEDQTQVMERGVFLPDGEQPKMVPDETASARIFSTPRDGEQPKMWPDETDSDLVTLEEDDVVLPFSEIPVETLRVNETSAFPENPLWARIEETEKKLEEFKVNLPAESTLDEFVEELRACPANLYVTLDNNALEELDLSGDTKITASSGGEVSASLALKQGLMPLGLTYTIDEDGDVIITSPERADEVLLMRVYDVSKYGKDRNTPQAFMNMMSVISFNAKIAMSSETLVVEAPYNVHKKIEKILASLPAVP